MANEKKLIEFNNVPKHVCIRDFIQEMFLLLKLRETQCKNIAGVLVKGNDEVGSSTISTDQKTFMMYVRSEEMIAQLKDICLKEQNIFFLYIFNSKIEVKFPYPGCWLLETMEVNDKKKKKDVVRIKGTDEQNVLNMLDILPNVYHSTVPNDLILSITQNKTSTFVKISNDSDAERIVRCYRRLRYNANFSESYAFIFKGEVKEPKRKVKISGNDKNMKIHRKFDNVKALNSPNPAKVIDLGIVNLENLSECVKSGTWRLILKNYDTDDEN